MSVAGRLGDIRARVEGACRRAGRPASDVTLVAVSKGQPASAVREAYAAAQRDFGESYAQELRDKARDLADLPGIRWHFIGPLQANKAKYVVGTAVMFHALDRVELAQALDQRLARDGGTLEVLLEVNVGGEASKHGVRPEDTVALAAALAPLARLKLRGLMCIPPPREDPQQVRPDFRTLRALAGSLGLPVLSMGMSDDFEVAIEEGATHVRVGTAIFGARPAKE
ncbi:MAG: YggS family pyridoxal phosphate-dependent enzyme [Deltaproteobacteria bacterium]|nr:YggS family pyridoxal phosphate-dependent enzyme [Deltaproteobacteria bacterium]